MLRWFCFKSFLFVCSCFRGLPNEIGFNLLQDLGFKCENPFNIYKKEGGRHTKANKFKIVCVFGCLAKGNIFGGMPTFH